MADYRSLILLTLVVLQVTYAQEPTLRILPDEILKAVGEGVYVSCIAEVDDTDLVTEMSWFGPDGERITNNNEEIVSTSEDGTPGNLALVISRLRDQDVGKYKCVATYAGNKRLEGEVKVESFMEIEFGDTPTHQTLLIGEQQKIKCDPKGTPAPTVDWMFNMEPVKNDENHIIQQDGILIKKVSETDEGTYRCRARVRSRGSMKQVDIQVEVNIPPKINMPPQNTTGREHEEAILECGATGKPLPKYTWVDNNNSPIKQGDNVHVNSETGVLKLMNLRPEQTGEYRCMAANSAGEDFKTAFLQVYTKPKVEEFLNITVSEGDNIELKCSVSGSPMPRVIFKKETLTHNFTQGINADDRITVKQALNDRGFEEGILEIIGVTRSDDGLYTCTAASDGGVTQHWGHITVEFKPTFEDQVVDEQWSWEKAPVNLTCLATSIPNATIDWYFQNEPVNAHDTNLERLEMGPLGVLRVNPVSSSYFGIYTCKASNRLGTAEYDLTLKEAHPPGPIADAKVEKKTATTVTWKLSDPADDGGLPVQTYIVEYRLNDLSWEDSVRTTWNKGSQYTIENLTPLSTYVFRFAARSKVGDGEWGGEKSVKMPGHAAPEEPLIFAAPNRVSPYPNHYDLQWKVPLDNGREIDMFQIIYYQVEEKEGDKWESLGERTTQEVKYPGTTMYKIEGLQSDSHYKIELRAHNDIGFSLPAEAIIRTAPDLKTATGPDPEATGEEGGANTGLVVGIIILLIVLVAFLVDVTCCCTRKAGLIATIMGKRGAKDKEKETMLEDGKNVSVEKQESNNDVKIEKEKGNEKEKEKEKEKEDLKAEEENCDKKESSEPTETTPMIQGENDDKAELKKEEKEKEKEKEDENLKNNES